MNAEFYLFDVDHGQCAALHLPNDRWCIFDAGSRADFSPVDWVTERWVTTRPQFQPSRYRSLASRFRFEKATISHLHGDHISDIDSLTKHLRSDSFGLRYPAPDTNLRKDIRDSNSDSSYPLVRKFLALCYAREEATSSPKPAPVLPPPVPTTPLPSLASLFAEPPQPSRLNLASLFAEPPRPSHLNLVSLLSQQPATPRLPMLSGLFAAGLNPPPQPAPTPQPVLPTYLPISEPNLGAARIIERRIPLAMIRKIPSAASAGSRVNNSSIISRIEVFGTCILLCGDLESEGWRYALDGNSMFHRQWQNLVSGIDILVAPHHGHSSGFSTDLLKLANPAVVLVSAKSGDVHVDSGYSGRLVKGIKIGEDDHSYISTRQKGHIKVTIVQPAQPGQKGQRSWSFGDHAIA